MRIIPEQQINELKERLDIVDIISDYVDLKRAGSSFKGLCPFHNEKTPSFMVSREKNNFHCFGCHAGGDTISFIMQIENLSYIEAIRFLADKIGMVLEETEYSKAKVEENNRYYEINSLAARYYFRNLLTEDFPQKYLQDRNLDKKILNKYFLGYAKNDNGLYHFLKEKDFKEEDMLTLGLIGKGDNGYYDKFRDRLIFPIINSKNKVIGFGGRTLINHNIKYINSPESPIFIKGKNIYGANVVNRLRTRDKIILVEGYMDVIALYNRGIDYAVATLGTAMTEDQARLVRRYARNVYIAYDGDEAGVKAALRAIDIFKNMDVELLIMDFPDNLDPDDYIKKFGKEEFEKLMKKAMEPIDFKLTKLQENAKSKMDFIHEIIEFLSDIEGNVIRDIYIDKSARFIGVSTDSLRNDVNIRIEELNRREKFKSQNINNNQNGYKNIARNKKITNRIINNGSEYANNRKKILEREFLLYSLLDINYFNKLNKLSEFLEDEEMIEIYKMISNNYKKNSKKADLFNNELIKKNNLEKDYKRLLEEDFSHEAVVKELKQRIEITKLEERKDELLKLIKSNEYSLEDMNEYTEILKKLTGSN